MGLNPTTKKLLVSCTSANSRSFLLWKSLFGCGKHFLRSRCNLFMFTRYCVQVSCVQMHTRIGRTYICVRCVPRQRGLPPKTTLRTPCRPICSILKWVPDYPRFTETCSCLDLRTAICLLDDSTSVGNSGNVSRTSQAWPDFRGAVLQHLSLTLLVFCDLHSSGWRNVA